MPKRPRRRGGPGPGRPGPGPGPNPFKTPADLAKWEQDLTNANAALDRMVDETRKGRRGQGNAVVSAHIAVRMMDPITCQSLLTAAIARLAFPPEELPEL